MTRRLLLTVGLVLLGMLGLLALPALAQVSVGLEVVGGTGLGSQDLRLTIVNIVRVVLGFLGLLAVLVILYAGFLWLTSRGNEEQIGKAKKILSGGVIGLVIILSAFAIASFVLNQLQEVTGGGEGIVVNGNGNLPGGGSLFQVESIVPLENQQSPRNTQVLISFNAALANDSLDVGDIGLEYLGTVAENPLPNADGAAVNGTAVPVVGNPRAVVFTASEPCDPASPTPTCFTGDAVFRAQVAGGSLRDTSSRNLSCANSRCRRVFQTSNVIDSSAPTAQLTAPLNGASVPVDSLVLLQAIASDDSGVSQVEFSADGGSLGADLTSELTPPYQASWSTQGLPLQSAHALLALATDVAGNVGDSSTVTVTVRAAHCFNGAVDADETGVDCGGSDCGACSGSACDAQEPDDPAQCVQPVDVRCASAYCSPTTCTCQDRPVITGLDPGQGVTGNYLTISGERFGSQRGHVYLLGSATVQDDEQEALPPAACAIAAWSDRQIIVQIPDGAASGQVRVVRAESISLFDDSGDGNGPSLPDFQIGGPKRPGLCSVTPTSGQYKDAIALAGDQFGTVPGQVDFGGLSVSGDEITTWANQAVTLPVPNLSPGAIGLSAFNQAGERSNRLRFDVQESAQTDLPRIDYLSPSNGPIGQYITVYGQRFGSTAGSVKFRSKSSGDVFIADTNFPAACSASYWTSTSITVKVPKENLGTPLLSVTTGDYNVEVVTATGASNRKLFSVNTEPLAPGICALNPANGPAGTSVTIAGDRLGSGGTGSSVKFAGNAVATFSSNSQWGDQQITGVVVPSGAITGPLQVFTGPAPSQQSNRLNFSVASCLDDAGLCTTGTRCCADGLCKPDGDPSCQVTANLCEFSWSFGVGTGGVGAACSSSIAKCVADDGKCSSANYCEPTSCLCQEKLGEGWTCDSDPVTSACTPSNICQVGYSCSADTCTCKFDNPPTVGSLSVVRYAPQDRTPADPAIPFKGVCKSEALGVGFNQAVDPASVTGQSVSIWNRPGAHRYWRLLLTGGVSSGPYYREIEWYRQNPDRTLVKATVGASALSQSGLFGFSAALAVDGSTATSGWHADNSQIGAYLLADLGAGNGQEFGQFRLYVDAAVPHIYAVQYSDDGEQFTSVATGFRMTSAGWNAANWSARVTGTLALAALDPSTVSFTPTGGWWPVGQRYTVTIPGGQSGQFVTAAQGGDVLDAPFIWSFTAQDCLLPADHVNVVPPNAFKRRGDTQPYSGQAYADAIERMALSDLPTWASSSQTVASVSPTSASRSTTATGLGRGLSQIQATVPPKQGSGTFTVEPFCPDSPAVPLPDQLGLRLNFEGNAVGESRAGGGSALVSPTASSGISYEPGKEGQAALVQGVYRYDEAIKKALIVEQGTVTIGGTPRKYYLYPKSAFDQNHNGDKNTNLNYYANWECQSYTIAFSRNTAGQRVNWSRQCGRSLANIPTVLSGGLGRFVDWDDGAAGERGLYFTLADGSDPRTSSLNLLMHYQTFTAGSLSYPSKNADGTTVLPLDRGTIMAWIRPKWSSSDGPGSWGANLLQYGNWWPDDARYPAYDSLQLYVSGNGTSVNLSVLTSDANPLPRRRASLAASINWKAGEWHHVALSYDKSQSGNNAWLYLDGQLAAQKRFDAFPVTPAAFSSFGIGWNLGADVDNFTISRQVLSPELIYEQGCTPGGAALPHVDQIIPDNGATGAQTQQQATTYVTIRGSGFGQRQGSSQVYFGALPAKLGCAWSDTEIVAQVPTLATGQQAAAVVITAAGSSNSDKRFTVNSALRPALCQLSPNHGKRGDSFTAQGANFGDVKLNTSSVSLNAQSLTVAKWSNTAIDTSVPASGSTGPVMVTVTPSAASGPQSSNPLTYRLDPFITSITPGQGPVGQYVTISGGNFGPAPNGGSGGAVFSSEKYADLNRCSLGWTETEIVAPVPTGAVSGPVLVETAAGLRSNSVPFTVNTDPVGANLCSLIPPRGAIGSEVQAQGDRFGANQGQSKLTLSQISAAILNWAEQQIRWRVPSAPTVNGQANALASGNVLVEQQVVIGQRCAGFSIGNWCPGGQYEDITQAVISNPKHFDVGCAIGTTDSRFDGASTVAVDQSQGAGTIASDGKYLYGKSWADFDQDDQNLTKLGTGEQGTAFGQDYGSLGSLQRSPSLTFSTDGYVYNGYSSDGKHLERMKVQGTGIGMKDAAQFPEGLNSRNGDADPNDYLITSDGKYLYNLSQGTDGVLGKFTVRVFEPKAGSGTEWRLVRQWTSADQAFDTRGFIADGRSAYAIEWGGDHRIRKYDAITGQFQNEWVSEQGAAEIIAGQYDWVNNTVWLGELVSAGNGPAHLYRYQSCVGEAAVTPAVVEDESCVNDIQSPSPYPGATTACLNGALAVRFTTDMDDPTVQAAVSLQRCNQGEVFDPAACATPVPLTFASFTSHDTASEGAIFDPGGGPLARGTWYQATVADTAKSATGLPLRKPYTWSFRTASSGAACAVDSLQLTPPQASIAVGEEQGYTAAPQAANCQVLNGSSYSYAYRSSDPAVASVQNDQEYGTAAVVANDSFEQFTAGAFSNWTTNASGSGASLEQADSGHASARSLELALGGNSPSGDQSGVYQTVAVEDSTWYQLTAWVRADSKFLVNLWQRILAWLWPTARAVLLNATAQVSIGDDNSISYALNGGNVPTTWTQVNALWKASGATAQIALVLAGDGGNDEAEAKLYVDQVSLTPLGTAAATATGLSNGETDIRATIAEANKGDTASLTVTGAASGADCGNGIAEPSPPGLEQCDGSQLLDQTCPSLGYGPGQLSCTAQCQFDTSRCAQKRAACANTPVYAIFGQLLDHASVVNPNNAADHPNVVFEQQGAGGIWNPVSGQVAAVNVVDLQGNLPKRENLTWLPRPTWQRLVRWFNRQVWAAPEVTPAKYTKVSFNPSDPLQPNAEFRLTFKGKGTGVNGGVRAVNGQTLLSDYVLPFSTGLGFCSIDRVEAQPDSLLLFSQADHPQVHARAVDEDGGELAAVYAWSEDDLDEVMTIADPLSQTVTVSPTAKSGAARLLVRAHEPNANALPFVSVPPSASWQLTGRAITIEAWVNPTSLEANGVYGPTVISTTDVNGYALRLRSDGIQADLRLTTGEQRIIFPASVPLGKWSHVAISYDGAMVRAYLDGNLMGEQGASGDLTVSQTTCLMIGAEPSGCKPEGIDFQFRGAIDEVAIYGRALLDAELTQHASATTALTDEEALVGYWRFSEGKGITSSGKGGIASLANAAQWTKGSLGQAVLIPDLEVRTAVPVDVFLCDHPWPNPVDGFPFQDATYQFSLQYCRGQGVGATALPALEVQKVCGFSSAPGNVTCPNPNTGLLREYLLVRYNTQCADGIDNDGDGKTDLQDSDCTGFDDATEGVSPGGMLRRTIGWWRQPFGQSVDAQQQPGGGSDAIGIRVFKNPSRLNPLDWYQQQGFPKGSPQGTTVDGYPAITDGTSTYVLATNAVVEDDADGCRVWDGTIFKKCIYPNIYLLSYSSGASEQTLSIVQALLASWRFNINLNEMEQFGLQRDLRRLSDLEGIGLALERYAYQHDDYYPALLSGSYINGESASVWPSWQTTLGAALGTTLPLDPLNNLNQCPVGFDPATCWNAVTQQFVCPSGSHIYWYDGALQNQYTLWANLEYDQALWVNVDHEDQNVSSGNGNECKSFEKIGSHQ